MKISYTLISLRCPERLPDKQEDLPCRVIWERDDHLTQSLSAASSPSPHVDIAWLEARLWTWVWYTQTKILRGEVYEALD
jgi:hypothetical protein